MIIFTKKKGIAVLRGGSWLINPDYCRSASRLNYDTRDSRLNGIGFRVVCAVGRILQ
ncbi:SUMF1/EgtB/PvdO family nonheme iron enzyme [Nodularia spumigena]|uniref:SUMF1/EgtB/PvdO family nonheme iron enzyme n=1 Tax=Nodularia spumigena TaxID=70799 RepID=UPI0030DCFD94